MLGRMSGRLCTSKREASELMDGREDLLAGLSLP